MCGFLSLLLFAFLFTGNGVLETKCTSNKCMVEYLIPNTSNNIHVIVCLHRKNGGSDIRISKRKLPNVLGKVKKIAFRSGGIINITEFCNWKRAIQYKTH